MFFSTNILYSVLDFLANNSQSFFTRKSSTHFTKNPSTHTYDEVVEMSYMMDPNTGEFVLRMIFGEVNKTGCVDERHLVSIIGRRVRIYTDKKEVYGGQPHQDLLDFGLSNEEIKILKIIFRLVRKMSSDK